VSDIPQIRGRHVAIPAAATTGLTPMPPPPTQHCRCGNKLNRYNTSGRCHACLVADGLEQCLDDQDGSVL
jgi:hypothetical protein